MTGQNQNELNGNPQVTVSFLLTKEDYIAGCLAASRAAYREAELNFLRLSGFILVISGIALRFLLSPSGYSHILYTLMVVLGVLLSFAVDSWQPMMVRRRAQRYFETRGERILAQTMIFDEQTVSIHTDRYRAQLPHSFLYRIYEDEKVFLLYTSQEEFWVLPKRALPPWDLMRVKQLLKRNENYKREGVR